MTTQQFQLQQAYN